LNEVRESSGQVSDFGSSLPDTTVRARVAAHELRLRWPGTPGNDPNAAGSIGVFIEKGVMAATLAEFSAGKRPAFAGTWYHLLNDGRGLVAEGPHPDSGPMAVVGGMGDFSGAVGQVLVNIIGANSTGCPNVRLMFILKKQAPK
jgi:hypothetical protein